MADEVNPYNAGGQPALLNEIAAAPPPTAADFTLELDDVVALSLHSPVGRKQRRIVVIGLCVAIAFVIWLLWKKGLRPVGIFAIVFVLGWSALLFRPLWRRSVRRACAKIYGDRLPRPKTIVVSSDGIQTATPESEGRHRWQAIQNIGATLTHVFFFVNNVQAVIVPARAFRSEARFDAFVTVARQYWTTETGRGL